MRFGAGSGCPGKQLSDWKQGLELLRGRAAPLGKRELKIKVGKNVFITSRQPVTPSQQGKIGPEFTEV